MKTSEPVPNPAMHIGVSPATFRSSKPWKDQRPRDLVVCCSDGRFHSHIEEFVDTHLGIPESDLLVIPGGPHALQLLSNYPKARWATKFFFEFLARHHQISRIVLIGHEGCAWYRSVVFAGRDLNLIKECQQQDLQAALGVAKDTHPRAKVELYFAKPEGGNVEFSEVA